MKDFDVAWSCTKVFYGVEKIQAKDETEAKNKVMKMFEDNKIRIQDIEEIKFEVEWCCRDYED